MFEAKIVNYRRDADGHLIKFEKTFKDPIAYNEYMQKLDQSGEDYFNNFLSDLGFDVGNKLNSKSLDKYEEEKQKIEYEKEQRKQKKAYLEDKLGQLVEYKKYFKEEGRDDLLKDINSDIYEVEKELSELEKGATKKLEHKKAGKK